MLRQATWTACPDESKPFGTALRASEGSLNDGTDDCRVDPLIVEGGLADSELVRSNDKRQGQVHAEGDRAQPAACLVDREVSVDAVTRAEQELADGLREAQELLVLLLPEPGGRSAPSTHTG